MKRSGITTLMGNMCMTDEEKRQIRQLMDNEAAEWAMRECIRTYQMAMSEDAMKLRGIYLAYITCGFSDEQAMYLTTKSIIGA